jgi:hypothetical protein
MSGTSPRRSVLRSRRRSLVANRVAGGRKPRLSNVVATRRRSCGTQGMRGGVAQARVQCQDGPSCDHRHRTCFASMRCASLVLVFLPLRQPDLEPPGGAHLGRLRSHRPAHQSRRRRVPSKRSQKVYTGERGRDDSSIGIRLISQSRLRLSLTQRFVRERPAKPTRAALSWPPMGPEDIPARRIE